MNREEFRKLQREKVLLLDGATGSNLIERGMPAGICPEKWILENPEALIGLQEEFLEAGTDILYAPTFACNRIKLKEYGLEQEIGKMNRELCALSKEAVERAKNKGVTRPVLIAGDMTMTGAGVYPLGNLMFEELVDVYKEQARSLTEGGVDLFVIETMMSLQECRAAVLAVKETCDYPVMVTLSFTEDGRTLYGTDPETAAAVMDGLGVDAVGINCSTGPEKMRQVLRRMQNVTDLPLIAKPNAGLPHLQGNRTVYDLEPKAFARETASLLIEGASMVGGCCGSTPAHIAGLAREIRRLEAAGARPEPAGCFEGRDTEEAEVLGCETEGFQNLPGTTVMLRQTQKKRERKKRLLTTERRTLPVTLDGPFLVVGERINPTGKKALKEQLKAGDLDLVVRMAEEQEERGAAILDINVGMGGIDEDAMMQKVVYEVVSHTDLPLSIDSSYPEVIEHALRIYPGRALINSISLEKEKMERLLPLAKKYGAMFVLLPLSETGLPKDLIEKKEIIHKIMERALDYGLTKEDIIVDGLVTTAGANPRAAFDTLETIRYCKELGLATICGLSNISFGLPERSYINSTFLALAIRAGLTMAIANPSQELLMNTAFAADLLLDKEDAAVRYIDHVGRMAARQTSAALSCAGSRENDGAGGREKPLPGSSIQTGRESQKDQSVLPSEEKDHAGSTERAGNERKQAGQAEAESTAGMSDSVLYQDVVKGNRRKILSHVKEELENGTKPSEIIDTLLIPAITETGRLFDEQIYFLPQLINSAEAMKTAVDYLEPLLGDGEGQEKKETVVMATVAGDIHDIGKNLVVLMLKNYGYRVIDLGKDVPAEEIVRMAKEERAAVVGLSALMTTTMTEMKHVITLIKEAGLCCKVILGGAVITQGYADEIGADGYSRDAQEAVKLVDRLLS